MGSYRPRSCSKSFFFSTGYKVNLQIITSNVCLFKVNIRNTRTSSEICSKLIRDIRTASRNIILVSLLLTLNFVLVFPPKAWNKYMFDVVSFRVFLVQCSWNKKVAVWARSGSIVSQRFSIIKLATELLIVTSEETHPWKYFTNKIIQKIENAIENTLQTTDIIVKKI